MEPRTETGAPAAAAGTARPHRPRPSTWDLFEESLRLGALGFGGGLSVLALIRARIVEHRHWLTAREFDNAATIAQMLPGGAASNALAYVGLRFRGQRGAAAAYVGFSLPGFVAILALAWLYRRFGTTPHLDAVLSGFNAAVVGVIASITLKMVATSVARLWQMAVAAGALLIALVGGASPVEVVLLGISTGLVLDVLLKRRRARAIGGFREAERPPPPAALPEEGAPLPEHGTKPTLHAYVAPIVAAGVLAVVFDRQLLTLATVFFRTGLGAYGGGFAIIPHLQSVMAERHWLTAREFADAVAFGKLTPGPVLLMATFIGYVADGIPAAIVATVAILLGPYLLVVTVGTWLSRVRSRLYVRAGLRGLTPAVVGLMAASAITLGNGLRGPADFGIAAAVALTLVRFRVNPVLLLALGGAARVGFTLMGAA